MKITEEDFKRVLDSIEFNCVSVPSGWRTGIVGSDTLIGPVYNNFKDLLDWQRDHLYGVTE